jgi:hypothetical protein
MLWAWEETRRLITEVTGGSPRVMKEKPPKQRAATPDVANFC